MKRVLVILPVLLLVVAATSAAAAWKLGYVSIGASAAQAAEHVPEADATARPTIARRKPLGPGEGITFATKDRVVNLTDQGGSRYLKASIVFELVAEDGKTSPTKPEEYKKAQEELAKELIPVSPAIEDLVTTVLTSKGSADLISADGKMALKNELKDRLNALFNDDRVIAVYFTQFIIQ